MMMISNFLSHGGSRLEVHCEVSVVQKVENGLTEKKKKSTAMLCEAVFGHSSA